MKCPKCEDLKLDKVMVQAVEVDRCHRCHGIWFDQRELATLLETDPEDLKRLSGKGKDSALDAKSAKCPRDQSALIRTYSARNQSVVVDWCPECHGIWLDGGEATRLVK